MDKKLLFFGGTFDPPHIEHINLLKNAVEELSPDKVIVMPTFSPPHKKTFLSATPTKRLKLCKAAFGDIKGVEVSDWEIKQKGKSFSYLTMQKLASEYPTHKIYFLMGTDMVSSFHTWKNPTQILKYATPLLCERQGEGVSAKNSKKDFYERFGIELPTLKYVGKRLSSTDIKIRKLLKMSVEDCLSPAVNRLIDEFSLYNGGFMADYLVDNLTEQRLEHTKGVISLALRYAKKQGVCLNRTLTASMLHDVAKYLDPNDFPDFEMPNGVPKPVVHQYLGAFVAKTVLGVKCSQVLNAIRYHTSAKPDMSQLAKIIFTADMLEEGRTYEGVEEMRRISFEDFEKGFALSLKRSLTYINLRGGEIYPLTQQAYDYYKHLLKE